MSRPRSVLLQEQKKDPAAAAAPPPPAAPTGSRPAAAAAAARGVPLAYLGGLGPAPPRRHRAQARLLHSCSRRVSGGELGKGSRLLVPGWGWASGGPERHGTPARPELVADGGVRGRGVCPPAQEAQRRRRHPVVVARGSTPCSPGTLAYEQSGTIPGVRSPGAGAPGLPRERSGRPWRRTRRGQPDPGRQRGGGGGRAPGPRSPHPAALRRLLWGAVRGRGSVRGPQGEGPACPAEPLLCMTQWFLEKALLGFPE